MEKLSEQDVVHANILKNRKEDALKSLELVNLWVNNIDAKTSYILAVAGIMIGYVLVQNLSAIDVTTDQTVKQIIKFDLLGSALYICCILSFILPILALKARVGATEYSNFFFGTIQNKKKTDFISGFKQMNEEESLDDILTQIHINSKICSKKVRLYNWGLAFLVCSIVLCFGCKVCGQI